MQCPEELESSSGWALRKEEVVSGVPKWGRSSKRRVRLIQWTRREIVSVAGLACLLAILSLVLAEWLAGHPVA